MHFLKPLAEPKFPADSVLTWPSALAVTNRLPSGEKRTQLTNWLCVFLEIMEERGGGGKKKDVFMSWRALII